MSITVPLEGFGGGGGAALNFDVKAYATEEALLAATPKENTIGIITENKITSWVFSATEPAEPAEGMVWITVGTESTLEFNALKKNAIQVYPRSAKQYVDGAWVDMTAMNYQGGKWKSAALYILKDGVVNSVVGNWIPANSSSLSNGIISATQNSNTGNSGSFANSVDVTNFTTLTFRAYVRSVHTAQSSFYLGLSKKESIKAYSSFVNAITALSASVNISSANGKYTEYALDISEYTGDYYIWLLAIATYEVDELILS